MFLMLQVVSVLLVSVAMSMALAHVLELPGKLRLDKEAYQAVQTIYYPGFTIGGAFGEGLGMVATLALLIATPAGSTPFWWKLAGFAALLAMHGTYWIVTHPVNKFWLKDQGLKGLGGSFFAFDPMKRRGPREDDGEDVWKRARTRWEYSHVVRAVLAAAALMALIVSVAI
jgi:Domain of unknown function (DUF1772)